MGKIIRRFAFVALMVLIMIISVTGCGTKQLSTESHQSSSVASDTKSEPTKAVELKQDAKEAEFKGWLIDKCCSKTEDITKHTKECLLMKSCADSGYGLTIQQENGTRVFYSFDDNGQSLSKDFLNSTEKKDDLKITVKGVLEGDNIKVISLTEGADITYKPAQSSEVKGDGEKVSERKATEIKGWLIDKCCSNTDDPSKHTTDCALMKSCAESGYGISVKQNDGKYTFYLFDQKGQDLAKDVLHKTNRKDDIQIILKGIVKKDSIQVEKIEEQK